MRRLKFILPFAAAALTLAIVTAASARPAHQAAAAKSQAVSCHGKLKIAMVTPLTGGAGFLGNEQLSWAKYAVKTLPRKYGFNISLVSGDTPVEAGPAPAQALAQKYVADPSVIAILGPSTSGAVAASSAALLRGRARACLRVRHSHVADQVGRWSAERGHGRLLPGGCR